MNNFVSLHRGSLDWLLSTQGRGIQPGLQRMERLLAALDHPEKELRCLHVAGTNGKGSVCAFAESVLRAAGYRTGLYTSPHLVEFSERIRINGIQVNDEILEAGIMRLQEVTKHWSEEEGPTFFEMVSALAFEIFAQAECDVIVLETGLGGRLDATNTAPKLACAITPIALDHTEWLGETLAEIAREKAGILRPDIPVVIAPQELEAATALALRAAEIGAPCEWLTEAFLSDSLNITNASLGLAGAHQRWNAALAISLLRVAGFSPSEESIQKGLSEVFWPGRFQRLRSGHLILDGAHNPQAARTLLATWQEEFGNQKCRLIFGALADKHPQTMLAILEEISDEILLVPVASPRSFDPALLLGGLPIQFQRKTRIFGTLKAALEDCFKGKLPHAGGGGGDDACHHPPILLTGSLFLVGEALALESGGGTSQRSQ